MARHGEARKGGVWRGEATQAWQGAARTGKARLGGARQRRQTGWGTKPHPIIKRIFKMQTEKLDQETKRQLTIQALESCRDSDGVLSTPNVVEAAKNPNSILHSYFEWDNEHAANQHRLEQAAKLIRSFKVSIVVTSHKMVVPLYVNHPSPSHPRSYLPLAEIKQDAVLSNGVILDEMSRIENAIKRAMAISCELNLQSEFEEMLEKILEIKTKIKGV